MGEEGGLTVTVDLTSAQSLEANQASEIEDGPKRWPVAIPVPPPVRSLPSDVVKLASCNFFLLFVSTVFFL